MIEVDGEIVARDLRIPSDPIAASTKEGGKSGQIVDDVLHICQCQEELGGAEKSFSLRIRLLS